MTGRGGCVRHAGLNQTEGDRVAAGSCEMGETLVKLEYEDGRARVPRATFGSPRAMRQSVSRLTNGEFYLSQGMDWQIRMIQTSEGVAIS